MARTPKKIPPRALRSAPGAAIPGSTGGPPVDHAKLIDAWGHFAGVRWYQTFRTDCVVCGAEFVFEAGAQKHLLEVKQIPVKGLGGTAFCERCRERRIRIHWLGRQKGSTPTERSARAAELRRLQAEERDERSAQWRSSLLRPRPTRAWPY